MNQERFPHRKEEPPRSEEALESSDARRYAEAAARVTAIWHDVERTGAVDSEREAFRGILKKLERREIGATMAVEEALSIQAARQDYH